MTLRRRKPQKQTRPVRPTTGAIGRACKRNSKLMPEGTSIKDFVSWMKFHGLGGEQHLPAIYLEYCEVVEILGGETLSLKRFRRALRNAGYAPYQVDLRKEDGARYRPTMVNLSEEKRELAVLFSDIQTNRVSPSSAISANAGRMDMAA